MAINTRKFDNWIRKHKWFALALPLVVLLLAFFIAASFNEMKGHAKEAVTENGYNNSLPNQSNELEVKDPNSYYKESLKDSMESTRKKGSIKNIAGKDKTKDSLEQILEDLDSFSFDENVSDSNEHIENKIPTINSKEQQKQVSIKKEIHLTEEEKLLKTIEENREYRKNLREANLKISNQKLPDEKIKIRVYVYRDQNVLPFHNVNLTVIDPFTYKGKYFESGFSLFGTVENVSNNKVFITVGAVGDLDINLKAYDPRRKHEGLYFIEAGKLEQELMDEIEDQGLQEVAGKSGSGLARTLASILNNNKKKKFTYIPLYNDYEMEFRNY